MKAGLPVQWRGYVGPRPQVWWATVAHEAKRRRLRKDDRLGVLEVMAMADVEHSVLLKSIHHEER
jgi:hypothetical protein